MSSGTRDDDRIEQFYARLLVEHGNSARALDWGSAASQQRRFEALAGVGRLDGARILDVGCGLGHFLDFLVALGVTVDYTGFDLTGAMVVEARRLHPGVRIERVNVLDADLPETWDYVFASGIFYLRRDSPWDYLRAMLERLAGLARRGVACNALSTRAGKAEADEFRVEPGRALELALDIAPGVVLRHDYLPNDFTVYLYPATPAARSD